MSEQWNFQWSIKSPAGGMLNIRTERADELEMALESITALIPALLSAEQTLTGAGNVAAVIPLAPPAQQPAPQQYQPAPPAPAPLPAAPSAPQQQVGFPSQPGPPPAQAPSGAGHNPLCSHGLPAQWVAPGVSRQTGRAYAGFWSCPLPREQRGNCRVNA